MKMGDSMRKNERLIGFDVDAYTARLIGRENVSKLEGAVLELVKNAYDADANTVCLYFSQSRNCIYIMDNGIGMDQETLQKHWMTIGNSSKKDTYLSRGKRVQTGAKGIGRFALDRIADKCDMLTRSDVGGLEWIVNWDEFNGRKKISEIKATIFDSDMTLQDFADMEHWKNKAVASMLLNDNFVETGTAFCLTGLHDVWNDQTMEYLRNHFENLLPPDVVNDFQILFFDDMTSAESAIIKSANLDSYDYKIDFNVEADNLEVQITCNEFDFGENAATVYKEAGFDKKEQEYLNGKVKKEIFSIKEQLEQDNCIGNYNGTFYFNKIKDSKKDRERFFYKDINGRENFAKRFDGIKLYRDKFRVRPYGEYGDNDFDWLELAARSSRSPAGLGHGTGQWRVRAEQMIGSVYISRENTNLEDAANRNGIQEGIGFSQLKQVLLFVINEFEHSRQAIGRKLAEYARKRDELEAEIEKMRELAEARRKWEEEQRKKQENKENEAESTGAGKKKDEPPVADPKQVENLIDSLREENREEVQELKDEIKMLQTLATTGIITNMFMHEIRTLTNNIGQELDAAYEAIKYDNDTEEAMNNILQAIVFKKNFASWFGITIDSIRKDKRFRKKHNIKDMLSKFLKTWENILEKNMIIFNHQCDEQIEFWCFEFDIENIISNLISNSLNSFDREMDAVLETKEINLIIKNTETGLEISYWDTGWGLIDKYKKRPEIITEAFESSRVAVGQEESGTGMGMWIVKKTVLEYNGSIDLSENQRKEKGFYIKIQMGGTNV